MRRRAQASIVAALFVIIALMILAVGFANVLAAQQSYVNQFQQSVQEDQLRSAESLTVLCSRYSNGTYAINVTDNSPFASEVLRVYYYNSTAFGWSWVNRSVGPGSTVTINVNPGGSWGAPQFAVVTALGNVFTCARPPAPSTSLPAPAVYKGEIWGGDEYSYSQVGDSVSRTVNGELFFYNSSTGTIHPPWSTSGGSNASIVVNDARYELELYPGYAPIYSVIPPPKLTSYPYTLIKAAFPSPASTSVLVVIFEYAAPYTYTYYSNVVDQPSPEISQLSIGLINTPSATPQATPQGYGTSLLTQNWYNASNMYIINAYGNGNVNYYNSSEVWLSPYGYHEIKLVGNASSGTYIAYLDGTLRSYHRTTAGVSKQLYGVFIYANGGPWYLTEVSAYTNDTVTVYNVPPGGTVEIIGRDAIGRPVFLEGVNSLSYPSAVSINIDNYYAPITGELVVTP